MAFHQLLLCITFSRMKIYARESKILYHHFIEFLKLLEWYCTYTVLLRASHVMYKNNISCTIFPLRSSISDLILCSHLISWCMHEASTLVNGDRIYGNGIFVLLDSCEWSKEEA